MKDSNEVGVDCGGPCAPCLPGTACTKDDDCSSLKCAASLCANDCTSQRACGTNKSAPCVSGRAVCAGGLASCVDGPVAAQGASCGTGGVCDGDGGCSTCVPNAPCTTNADPCRNGQLQCAATAVCANAAPKSAGAACGSNLVCAPDGGCVTCAQGSSCAPNSCSTATTHCVGGVPTCNTVSRADAGVSCGSNQVCDGDGGCNACTAGQSCSTNPGAPCFAGQTSCASGTQSCIDVSAADAGVACVTRLGPVGSCDGQGGCALDAGTPGGGCDAGFQYCASASGCIAADAGCCGSDYLCPTPQICCPNGLACHFIIQPCMSMPL